MQAAKPVRKPRRQRKMLQNAPGHTRYKLMAAPVSSELSASRGAKSLPVRKGDTVRILRGDHKGFEGKISRVDRKKYRIYIEGLTREKVDGTTVFVPVHPSKVIIKNLNLDDNWRKKILENKKAAPKRIEEAVEKRPEVAEIKEEVVEEKVTAEKKLPEKKPKARRRKVTRKTIAKKKKEKVEEAKKEGKPKAKKTRAKRKTPKKTEGGT